MMQFALSNRKHSNTFETVGKLIFLASPKKKSKTGAKEMRCRKALSLYKRDGFYFNALHVKSNVYPSQNSRLQHSRSQLLTSRHTRSGGTNRLMCSAHFVYLGNNKKVPVKAKAQTKTQTQMRMMR